MADGAPPIGQPRGSHVSVAHPSAYAVMQALIARPRRRSTIGDFRVAPSAPARAGVAGSLMEDADPQHEGVMRFGITPLYLRFTDVDRAVESIEEVLRTGVWQEPRFQVRQAVT
ncbi:MAG: hypothetical protein ACKOH8_10565 [Gemmatimonadota bacterium]